MLLAPRRPQHAAIALGIPHGGWCPGGRRAQDGTIPARYILTETPGANYLQRTEWNVRDSDGTVVFTLGKAATGAAASDRERAGSADDAGQADGNSASR